MKLRVDPPQQIALTPELEAVLDLAWLRACERRPVFGLLRRPNSITAAFSRAIKEKADSGVDDVDSLLAAALATLPEHGQRP